MRNKHILQQAKLGRELQELNNMLQRKQELAKQMIQSDEQMHEMRAKYEVRTALIYIIYSLSILTGSNCINLH